MTTPPEVVAELEKRASLPAGGGERFSGYGVMSTPFVSGHILAMRRFPTTSIGPGYTSVWHRDPQGRWVFYQDQPPDQACSRYFGQALHETIQRDIQLDWTGPLDLSIRIGGDPGLSWDLTMEPTISTRVLNAMGRIMPAKWWRSPAVLTVMGHIASTMLRAGSLQLAGQAPNGQHFMANPKQLWMIPTSHAVVAGTDLGAVGPTTGQARLGDFSIPNRGIFAIGDAFFEPG